MSEAPIVPAAPRPTAERPQAPVPTAGAREEEPPQAVAAPAPTKRTEAAPAPTDLYIVQVAVLSTRSSADRLRATLTQAGFHPYIVRIREGFAVRLGAFREAANAQQVARQAHGQKFPAAILHRPQ